MPDVMTIEDMAAKLAQQGKAVQAAQKVAGETIWWKLKLPHDQEGIDQESWDAILREAKKIIAKASRARKVKDNGIVWDAWFAYIAEHGIKTFGPGGSGRPELTQDHIALNGPMNEFYDLTTYGPGNTPFTYPNRVGLESFYFSRDTHSGNCKTHGKPYGAVVISILAMIQGIVGKALSVSAEGGPVKRLLAAEPNADRVAGVSTFILSLAPDGAPVVDGGVDEVLFGMILAKVLGLPKNQVRPKGFKNVDVGGDLRTWKDALQTAVVEAEDFFRPMGRKNVYQVKVNLGSLYKGAGATEDDDKAQAAEDRAEADESKAQAERQESEADREDAASKTAGDRPLNEIAREIRRDWKKVNYAAEPYLDAMGSLRSIDDDYYQDTGTSIVAYFLSNARAWRGPVAKEIKAELKKMLKKRGMMASEDAPFTRQRLTWGKDGAVAPGGLYGFTKADQRDCEVAIRRVAKQSHKVARAMLKRDRNIAAFLQVHAKRAKSVPAKILIAAIKDVTKVASRAKDIRLRPNDWFLFEDDGGPAFGPYRNKGEAIVDYRRLVKLSLSDFAVISGKELMEEDGLTKVRVWNEGELDKREEMENRNFYASVDKDAKGFGLYGYRAKTARLGLNACSEIREYTGKTAFGLHQRRAARHQHITGFFQEHSKKGRCLYSRILLSSYPGSEIKIASTEEENPRTASLVGPPDTVDAWLAWDEG